MRFWGRVDGTATTTDSKLSLDDTLEALYMTEYADRSSPCSWKIRCRRFVAGVLSDGLPGYGRSSGNQRATYLS